MEFRLFWNRHLPTTHRLAADGRRYTWEEFATYYRDDARAMWEAARQREICMAIWYRVVSIRWRTFTRKLNIFKRVCWIYAYRLRRYAYRLIVDKRIDGGPRLVPPKDWPEAPAVAEPEAPAVAVPAPWDDYIMEEVYGPDYCSQDDDYRPDIVERRGDYVSNDLFDRDDW